MIRSGIRDASSREGVRCSTTEMKGNKYTLGDHSTQRHADDMQTTILSPLEVVEEAEGILCHPARPIAESIHSTDKEACTNE